MPDLRPGAWLVGLADYGSQFLLTALDFHHTADQDVVAGRYLEGKPDVRAVVLVFDSPPPPFDMMLRNVGDLGGLLLRYRSIVGMYVVSLEPAPDVIGGAARRLKRVDLARTA